MFSINRFCFSYLVLFASIIHPSFSLTLPKHSPPTLFYNHDHCSFRVDSRSMRLSMGFLNDIGNNLFGGNKAELDPSIPTRVMEIPAKKIKVGGLRFTLGLILISLQNTPSKQTWQATQAGDDKLDMYFMVDQTAMFSMQFTEYSITIDRYGARPSLPYMLQESLVMHTILDELEHLASGKNEGEEEVVDEQNRLIQLLDSGNAIQLVRDTLPARKA